MNESEDNPIERTAEAEAEKPKAPRRKRAPKAEASVDAAGAVDTAEPAVAAPVEAPSVEAAHKPARKRRTTKAAAEVVEDADAAPVESPAAAEPDPVAFVAEAPAKTRPARSRAAPKPAEESLPEPAPESSDGSGNEAVATFELGEEAPQAAAADSSDEDGPGSGPRAGRNRRRNRKERQRERAANGGEKGERVVTPAAPAVDAGEVFAHVMSADFDVEEPAVEADADEATEEAAKRVLQPDPEAPKLHKVLAQAGVGSRRDMEELILEGKITVNDQPAHVGQRISFGDQIKVDGKPVRVRIVPPPPRIIAYHKPVGEVVSHDDPQNRPTVFRRLPRLQQGKWQSVGRLDLNTEGLLLFTNSGDLANQLMHPRFGVEREYAVRVLGTLSEDAKAQLLEGVDVEGQTASFKSIVNGGGEGANHWYRVVITEGRNREVRKLFDAVSLTVSRLIRIRYGTVVLPRGLRRGVWVDLEEGDVRAIRRLASGGGDGQRREGRPERPEGRNNGNNGNNGNANANAGRNVNNNGRNGKPQRNDVQGGQGGQQGGRNDRGPRPNRGHGTPNPVQVRDEPSNDFDRDEDLDFDPSKIPNPLEQTFDKRFVQKPRGPAGGAGFGRGGGGFGAGGSAPVRPAKKGSGPREPDPLQTSLGYIGADAFHRRGNKGGGGGGGGGGGNRGGNRSGGGGGNSGGGGGGFGKGGGGGRRGR